ncbi:MAG: BLUF domain-containing protein [Burkholderiaceae bacterium]
MLVSLFYVSRAVGPQTTTVTSSLLTTARAHNAAHDISGVLFQGQGMYLQLLEGERSAVNRLYARILADQRHADAEILFLHEVTSRRFSTWSMAHVALSGMDPMVQMNHPEFDPYAASAQGAARMLDDFIASGVRIDTPAP